MSKPIKISIHPPRAGWDSDGRRKSRSNSSFQSTHPVRGGTRAAALRYVPVDGISIHPPRAGWDCILRAGVAGDDISIHPPRAGWDGLTPK